VPGEAEPLEPDLRALLAGIGNRIAYLRRRAGLTQQDAADLAEIDLRQWGRLEAGKTNPTVKTLYAVARALQVDLQAVVKPRFGRSERRRGRPRRE
jgi:transcriptional regulator with XRE-family HTH domain